MASSRKSSLQMTQAQWADWAIKRQRQADEVAKLYRRQAREISKLLDEVGCRCNPLIVLPQGEMGGPSTKDVHLTHGLDCPNG